MSAPSNPPPGAAPSAGSNTPSSPSASTSVTPAPPGCNPLPPGTIPGVISPTPVVLPDSIPQTWVTQIKAATKTDRTAIILAIVVALISGAVAVLTTYWGIRASGDLEIKKAHLADCQADNKVTLASYDLLESNVSQLRQQFDGLETLVQIAQSENALRNPKDAANIRTGIEKLGEKLGAVLALKSDVHLNAKVWDQVDKSLDELGTAIRDTDPNFANFSAASAQTESDLSAAIDAVQKARAGISTNADCYKKL